MDNGTLALLIPVLALSIPVAGIVMSGLQKIAKSRVEEARLRGGAGGEPSAAMDQLRTEIQELRQDMMEIQERMDFAERVLTKGRESGRLPGPS